MINTPTGASKMIGNSDIAVVHLYRICLRHLWLIITVPFAVALAVYLFLTLIVKPTYISTALFIPPQQQQGSAAALLTALPGIASLAGGGVAGFKNPSDQWIGLLRSNSVTSAIVEQEKLPDYYKVENKTLAKNILEEKTKILTTKEGLVRLEVEDHDPKKAQIIASRYLHELRVLTEKIAKSEANQRKYYFEGLMNDAKNKLVNSERELKVGGINKSLLRASPDRVAAEFSQLNSLILAQKVRISTLQTQFTTDSPQLKQASAELKTLERQLMESESGAPGTADENGSDYIERYRNFKYHEALFEIMAKQYEMARADELRQGVSLQVVDEPQVAETKSKPQKAFTTVFAYAISLVVCCVGIALWESIRSGAQSSAEQVV